MKISLAIVSLLCATMSCTVSSVKLANSRKFEQTLYTQDSIYIWTSQWHGKYDYIKNEMTSGSTIYGNAMYFTKDSVYYFSLINGFVGADRYKLLGNTLKVNNDYPKKVIHEDSMLYLIYYGSKPSVTYDSLYHDMIESYLKRKVPTKEVLYFLTNQDSSYFRDTFLGIETSSWCRLPLEPKTRPLKK